MTSGKSGLLRIVQENEIWPYSYRHKPESILDNEMHKILLDLEIQIDHLIPAQKIKPRAKKKKKLELGI